MINHIRRREFITLLGGAAASWPLAVRAQQPAMPVIGYLGIATADAFEGRLRAFRQGLNEMGFVEGRNVAVEYRWAEGQYDRLSALAADLIRRQVAVIAATGGSAGPLAAKLLTTTIPIVFEMGGDPVATGIVPRLNRPGGNVTGITSLNVEINAKRLELLHELIPTATAMALLVNPDNPVTTEAAIEALRPAAARLGLQLQVLNATAASDLPAVFAAVAQLRAGGLVIGAEPLFASLYEQIAALALRTAVPTVFYTREFVVAGGLMSYSGNLTDSHRLAGNYVGRILKGAKPADLPVQQATRVELIINMKTAKALGLTFPLTLLGRADEVIE